MLSSQLRACRRPQTPPPPHLHPVPNPTQVTEALSYWINALRLCQPGIKGSACEFMLDANGVPMDDTHPDGPKLGENMDLLFRKHHGSPVTTETEILTLRSSP